MVDNHDFEYMKKKGYKATSLLRSKIQELKQKDIESSQEEIERKLTMERLINQRRVFFSYLDWKNLSEDFLLYEKQKEEDENS